MLQRCFRVLALVVANSVVTVLGLLLSVIGVWMRDKGHDYYFLFDDATMEISQLPILLIVVGGLIFFVGIVGILGGVLSKTVGGRIVLGMYGFILAFLIVCEIAGGIAGAVSTKHFKKNVDKALNTSFSEYFNSIDVQGSWNSAQDSFQCCGHSNYTDYKTVFNNDSIPESCCNTSAIKGSKSSMNCTYVITNTFSENNLTKFQYVWAQNCTIPIESFFLRDFRAIAGVAITFGILQVIGVVISCVAALPQKDPRDEFEPL